MNVRYFFFKNPDQEKKEVESCLEEEKESRKGRGPTMLKAKRKEPAEERVSRFRKWRELEVELGIL